jgi:Zn-dependent protease
MFDDINTLLLSALAALLCLTVHEVSHGYVAYKLGDPTAYNLGRLSLNPIKHLDPLGTISLILFRFGWAKPVPVNSRYFKKPKRDFALVALGGPVSNMIMAFLAIPILFGLQILFAPTLYSQDPEVTGSVWYNFCNNSIIFLSIFHYMNIGLAIFNLIPIPPLDGSRLLSAFLPYK